MTYLDDCDSNAESEDGKDKLGLIERVREDVERPRRHHPRREEVKAMREDERS